MNGTSPLEGRGDTFERRLLKELTEIDARRAIATSPPARPRRGGQRRPGTLVVAVVAALVVAGGATAAASIVLRPDRADKELPLGTATTLRPGERTGIKGRIVRYRAGPPLVDPTPDQEARLVGCEGAVRQLIGRLALVRPVDQRGEAHGAGAAVPELLLQVGLGDARGDDIPDRDEARISEHVRVLVASDVHVNV